MKQRCRNCQRSYGPMDSHCPSCAYPSVNIAPNLSGNRIALNKGRNIPAWSDKYQIDYAAPTAAPKQDKSGETGSGTCESCGHHANYRYDDLCRFCVVLKRDASGGNYYYWQQALDLLDACVEANRPDLTTQFILNLKKCEGCGEANNPDRTRCFICGRWLL